MAKQISRKLNIEKVILILSIVGVMDSLYLAYIKLSNNQAACIQGVGDCWTVNTSKYSEVFGIPVAILGALAYLTILGLILIGINFQSFEYWSKLAIFGFGLSGSIFSIYLTYLEIAVIRAICPFCLLSLVLMATIFILSIFRLNVVEENS